MNQSQLEAHTCNPRQARENECQRVTNSRLSLGLLLIGLQSSAKFAIQLQNVVNKTKATAKIIFDTQTKTVLVTQTKRNRPYNLMGK